MNNHHEKAIILPPDEEISTTSNQQTITKSTSTRWGENNPYVSLAAAEPPLKQTQVSRALKRIHNLSFIWLLTICTITGSLVLLSVSIWSFPDDKQVFTTTSLQPLPKPTKALTAIQEQGKRAVTQLQTLRQQAHFNKKTLLDPAEQQKRIHLQEQGWLYYAAELYYINFKSHNFQQVFQDHSWLFPLFQNGQVILTISPTRTQKYLFLAYPTFQFNQPQQKYVLNTYEFAYQDYKGTVPHLYLVWDDDNINIKNHPSSDLDFILTHNVAVNGNLETYLGLSQAITGGANIPWTQGKNIAREFLTATTNLRTFMQTIAPKTLAPKTLAEKQNKFVIKETTVSVAADIPAVINYSSETEQTLNQLRSLLEKNIPSN